jgi:hypothetical protein
MMRRSRQTDSGADVFAALASDAFAVLTAPVRDSQVSVTVRLTGRDTVAGTLRLPPAILAEVARGGLTVEMLRESVPGIGAAYVATMGSQRDGDTLTGLVWPRDVVAGARVTVTAGRGPGVCRIRVDMPNPPEEVW